MSANPEERRQQRKRRQAKQLRLRLILAGVVAALFTALVLVLINLMGTAPSDTGASTAPAGPATTVIHYAAVGDLNINDATVSAGGENYDYTKVFMDVAHLLADADIASVNFEGNFGAPPYGDSFSAPQSMAEAMKNMGIDLVQLANS